MKFRHTFPTENKITYNFQPAKVFIILILSTKNKGMLRTALILNAQIMP